MGFGGDGWNIEKKKKGIKKMGKKLGNDKRVERRDKQVVKVMAERKKGRGEGRFLIFHASVWY